jgi:hypothetical protein
MRAIRRRRGAPVFFKAIMENRFVDRELTVREAIYLSKGAQGDFESGVLLVESRLREPIAGLRDWPMSDWNPLFEECLAGISEAAKMTFALVNLIKASR